MEFDFIKLFYQKIKEKNLLWEVSGLVSSNGMLYSLGSDSKLIGRIFELILYGILQEIANENGYILQPSDQQTVYPDFTLMKSLEDDKKIAIDIKTTYRSFRKDGQPFAYGFTLGSYASFIRNGTKNIMFPYKQYVKHYIVGCIYTRNEQATEGKTYSLNELSILPVPYKDVEIFVQEKYKIAGDKPGSGNTENIGSYKTNRMDYLINGEGPFSVLGIEIFEDYWRGYPKYRQEIKNYTSLDGYFEFYMKKGIDLSMKKRLYTYWKKEHNFNEKIRKNDKDR